MRLASTASCEKHLCLRLRGTCNLIPWQTGRSEWSDVMRDGSRKLGSFQFLLCHAILLFCKFCVQDLNIAENDCGIKSIWQPCRLNAPNE